MFSLVEHVKINVLSLLVKKEHSSSSKMKLFCKKKTKFSNDF